MKMLYAVAIHSRMKLILFSVSCIAIAQIIGDDDDFDTFVASSGVGVRYRKKISMCAALSMISTTIPWLSHSLNILSLCRKPTVPLKKYVLSQNRRISFRRPVGFGTGPAKDVSDCDIDS